MRIIFFLLLILAVPAAHAASIFEPPPTDISLIMLRNIFGEVSGVLELGGTELLKNILVDFNNAVLVLGGIIIIYSLMVSTMNTANEGEMLGRQWNSVWIPLRAASGFALLLPVKAKGYALIQVFFMWVVVQGVGAADTLWARGIDMIKAGEPAYVPTASVGVYNSAQSIFKSLVCEKQVAADLNTSVRETGSPGLTQQRTFGVRSIPDLAICGSVDYEDQSDPDSNGVEVNNAIDAMINSLEPAATAFVNAYTATGIDYATQLSITNQIQSAAETYNSTLSIPDTSAVGASSTLSAKEQKALDAAKAAGWVAAGSYFMQVTEASSENIASATQGPGSSGPKLQPGSTNDPSLERYLHDDDYDDLVNMLNYVGQSTTPDDMQINDADDIMDYLTTNGLGPIEKLYMSMLSGWQGALTGSGGQTPIIAIQTFGQQVSNLIAVTYLGLIFGISTLKALLAGAASITQVGLSTFLPGISKAATFIATFTYALFSSVVMYLTPAILIIVSALFLAGLSMAYYVPMVPFIVFSMGVIAWLILVVEAMVAAPLVAIGILHPEGQHTVFGKSEAGIMIIASVFLRPPLMIVGFFASILMAYIVVTFINVGILPVATALLNWSPFSIVYMIVIYTGIILIVVNKAFSLIHVVPDKIMRWIGTQTEQAAEATGELRETSGTSEKAGGETTKGLTGAGDVAKQRAYDSEAARRKARSDGGGTGSSGSIDVS